MFIKCLLALLMAGPLFFTEACDALIAGEVLIVANRHAWDSVDLAEMYMQKRGIPKRNLLKISVTDKETCNREEYDNEIAKPIKKKLLKSKLSDRPRCIMLMKGVPLKVAAVPLTDTEQAEIDGLNDRKKKFSEQLKQATNADEKERIKVGLATMVKKIKAFKWEHNTGASVDSELSLVLADAYPLPMWVPNPFFLGFKGQTVQVSKSDVIMVSRLDAPNEQIVQRMIDDAIAAEKIGLKGKAYFDARYKDPGDKKVTGYGLYDKSIHLAADRIREKKRLTVVLEDTQKLFQPGECPQAALYCGWYKLAHYVDAFDWVPGAIGYHIASSECWTLRKGDSQVWCKRMLEDGVTVTIGPVGEPYLQAFPLPEVFFGLLAEGKLTVAECYLLSVPYLSWKMVLVGDPLYRPFTGQD